MKKIIIAGAVTILAVALMAAADTVPPIPSDDMVSIHETSTDILEKQAEVLQLQQRYIADQTALNDDNKKLEDLKKKALTDAKLDGNKYDVDVEHLKFVEKTPASADKK